TPCALDPGFRDPLLPSAYLLTCRRWPPTCSLALLARPRPRPPSRRPLDLEIAALARLPLAAPTYARQPGASTHDDASCRRLAAGRWRGTRRRAWRWPLATDR